MPGLDEPARVFRSICLASSLVPSYSAEEGWSPGSVFISGLAALWRRLCPSLGIGSLLLVSRIHGCSVVIMKKNIKERTVNVQIIPSVVFDKAQFSEAVHEEADPRPCRPYHLCQSLLI